MRRPLAALGAALILTGCGNAAQTTADAAALPACGSPPSPAKDPVVDGALLPPGSRVTAVRAGRQTTQLNAYVTATPDEVVAFVKQVPGVTVEAAAGTSSGREVLTSARDFDVFLRATAVCARGSVVLEIVAPAGGGATLPQPGDEPPRDMS